METTYILTDKYKNQLNYISVRKWVDTIAKINQNNLFIEKVHFDDSFNIGICKIFNLYFYYLETKFNNQLKLENIGNLNKYLPINFDYNKNLEFISIPILKLYFCLKNLF